MIGTDQKHIPNEPTDAEPFSPESTGSLQAGMLSVTLVWLVLVVLIAAVVLTLVGERQIRLHQDAQAGFVAEIVSSQIEHGHQYASEAELLEVVRSASENINTLRILPIGVATHRITNAGWAAIPLPDGRIVEMTLVTTKGGPARLLNTLGIMVSLGMLFLLMSVFLVVMVGRMIGKPINDVAKQASRLAAGNLTAAVTKPRSGQFGRIGANLEAVRQQMAAELRRSEQASEELHQTNSLQRLMLRELNHRIRNNLASLGSLIAISRSQDTEVAEFAQRIERRVEAMASAHSLLSERHWTPVAFQSLLERLTPVECAERMSLRGGDVPVSASQATPLAMVLQEMFANAMAHGSLGSGTGWLSVEWDVGEGTSGELLIIHWKESGGPAPNPDAEAGTGTALIRGLIEGELRGEISLHHAPTGVSHRIRIPLEPGGSIGEV
jgi:two-component sensor histidine kinase